MSIIRKTDFDFEVECHKLGMVNRCLFCGKNLNPPVIHWEGANGQAIYMHPKCCHKLAIRIARDLWELEHESRK